MVIVTKRDGTTQFYVDYRQLNSQMENEVAQLPPIRGLLHESVPATVFTSLDLKSGYWQVPMAPESIKYTAFSTLDAATYELQVKVSTFQKLMVDVYSRAT